MAKFTYYENGFEEIFTIPDLMQIFNTCIDASQKTQGTTFDSWLYDMERMNLLTRL